MLPFFLPHTTVLTSCARMNLVLQLATFRLYLLSKVNDNFGIISFTVRAVYARIANGPVTLRGSALMLPYATIVVFLGKY